MGWGEQRGRIINVNNNYQSSETKTRNQPFRTFKGAEIAFKTMTGKPSKRRALRTIFTLVSNWSISNSCLERVSFEKSEDKHFL